MPECSAVLTDMPMITRVNLKIIVFFLSIYTQDTVDLDLHSYSDL